MKEIKSATSEIREKKNEVERQKSSNLEMSKRILEQDKQLILSATANTVAHSLNSPLGAIKAGAESIIYIYNDIFTNVIQKCSPQQITFGYNYAKKYHGSLIESGKQSLVRIKIIKKYLSENHKLKEEECNELSVLISKVYIESELKSITEFIVKQENKTDVIKMITSLVSFEKITKNTLNATQKYSKVVESLKNALKQGRADKKVSVNVCKSIWAVIEVIDDEIHKSGEIKNIVDQEAVFNNTNEYKFFQLWSNLFTLLLNSSDKEVLIQIRSEKQNGSLIIRFEVNFKLKEDLFDGSVYDIIMNKKHNSIDLSRAVIKNIIQENHGSISIDNLQQMSIVNIQIPNDRK